jgi:hypothetical protein
MYRDELRNDLGLTFDLIESPTLEIIERSIRECPADVAVIMVDWKERASNAVPLFQRLSEASPRPRLVLLDYTAPTSSGLFYLLPYVDRFIKRQVLRDTSLYQAPFEKGFIFTDFLAREMGFDLSRWPSGNKIPDPSLMHKVVYGWNLGVTPRYRRILAWSRRFSRAWNQRPIAINRRVGMISPDREQHWYHQYRALTLQAIEPLSRRVRCSGIARVSPKRYYLELLLSKLVISPFGWGELCFRDYETIAAGGLLIKPSMSHLKTSPDIFQEYETYVPVKWDLSDLVDTCEYYLNHPRESLRIVRNGQAVLRDYFENRGFVDDIRRCLSFPS